jgi:plasmid stabilization system protein ParE
MSAVELRPNISSRRIDMFNFYFNVNANTETNEWSESTDAARAYALAAEMHRDHPEAEISLEIVLMRDGYIYYESETSPSVNAKIVLYKANQL